MPKRKKPTCYGVFRGRRTGVFYSWDECEKQVKGFTGARFKGFPSVAEAEAFVRGEVSNERVCANSSPETKRPETKPSESKRTKLPTIIQNPYRAKSSLPHFSIMFDGGSRGNPGNAGSGAAVTQLHNNERKTWHLRYHLDHKATNNEAEYAGVIIGLQLVLQECQSAVDLVIQGDSKLVIKQMSKEWKVNTESLRPYHQKAMSLLDDINTADLQIQHVYRENNKVADELANAAMDARRSWWTSSDDQHEEQHELCTEVTEMPTKQLRQLKVGAAIFQKKA